MTPCARRPLLIALFLFAFPAAALADGPPVGGWAEGGVVGAGSRYMALPASRGTLLERLSVKSGRLLRTHYLKGHRGIPMVALDGTPGGLSADGRTLVLSSPRTSYPQRTSTLYLTNAGNLTLRRRITLRGDFSFDAISPDGATLYLIQLSPRNFTRYAVRALDTGSGRLFAKPVVDRREPDEAMRGLPYTRVMSPDSRYAYTLYGGGDKPFVHALDTRRRSAACIDIPRIPNNAQMSLRLKGKRLTVLADGSPISYVDTATRKVSSVPKAAPPQQAATGSGSGSSTLPTWLVGGLAAAALGVAAMLGARRRRAGDARS